MRSLRRPGAKIGGTNFTLRARERIDPIYNETFRRRIEVWCRARAGDRNIRIEFGSSGSYTDMAGNITVDKTVPKDGRPGDKALATWGLTSHELCHHRWTAADVFNEFIAKMKDDVAESGEKIKKIRGRFAKLPDWAKIVEAEKEQRAASFQHGQIASIVAGMEKEIPNMAPADAKEAKKQLTLMKAEMVRLEAEATAAGQRRDALIAPNQKAFDKLTAELHAEQRKQIAAVEGKDVWNIIEDGRIETHLRVHEPNEYRQISMLNHVYPRVPKVYKSDQDALVPCPDGYVPVDVDGNPLEVVVSPDGTKMVKIPAGVDIPVLGDKPLDYKRQMRAALLCESVPEFTLDGELLHPKVQACLDECRPLIDEGVRGNTRECMEASAKVTEILARHGMLPDPEDEKSNNGGQQQQGQGGESGGDPGQGGGQGQPGQGQPGQGGGQGGDEEQSGGDSGLDTGSPFDTGDEWDERGDAGKAGDGTSDTTGSAKEGDDGGGISDADRKDAEEKKAGSASGDEAKEAAKQAEKDAAADVAKESGRGNAADKAGDIDGKSWGPPANQKITGIEKIAPQAPTPPSGHLTRYGNQLAAQLELVRTQATAPRRRQESGRLDRRRITSAAIGKPDVFVQPGRDFDVDLAVDTVVDLSGSMNSARKQLQDSAQTMVIAMEKLKVPHSVYGFDSGGSSAHHYELVGYGSRANGLGAIAGSHMVGGGGTPTAEAVEFANARLSQRREQARVMVIFTDGMPNDIEGTRRQIEAARSQGITVVGAYYNTAPASHRGQEVEGMKKLFGSDFVHLEAIGDLPKHVGKLMMKLIKPRRRH
ncbi:VWA domain-containing protein [Miltoncostaea oceani]|uniref:VWA domain-containing protein n=1 Tax=Miltoncostaea oceani TaxID=2843216 RepID=UPI001C3CB819|nr:VWA domain-containing protein [Miltoncostaea oceani]